MGSSVCRQSFILYFQLDPNYLRVLNKIDYNLRSFIQSAIIINGCLEHSSRTTAMGAHLINCSHTLHIVNE